MITIASAQGVEAFLSTVLSKCMLPAYLYNFPKHTGNTITPEMYARLAVQHPAALAGIKVKTRSDTDANLALMPYILACSSPS
jgi:dihydrodipicolinate synthase/N-acetylneuraminate lyase